MEADLYPRHRPDLADLIDGAIGELSPFEERFGYYAQGVGPETAVLPSGWQSRLVKVQNENTDLKIGWCLEPHDLAAAKLAAGRGKDLAFVAALLAHHLVNTDALIERIDAMPLTDAQRSHLRAWIRARGDADPA